MFQEKRFVAKNGQQILLRLPQESDLKELLRYANELSIEDTYLAFSGERVSLEEEQDYLYQIRKEIKEGIKFQLFAYADSVLVANAEIRRITKHRRRQLHVGIVAISVDQHWRGQGIGKQILLTLIDEAKKMDLKLLTLTAFSNNSHALSLYLKLGFQKAGEIPGAIWYKGDYVAEVSMYLPLV